MARTTPAANRGAETDLRALHSQVAELGDQLGHLLNQVKQNGGQLAEAELSQLQDKLTGLLDDAKDKGRDALATVEETVRERPGTSLLAAFAAGAVLTGLLLRR